MVSEFKLIKQELEKLGLKASLLSAKHLPEIKNNFKQNVCRDKENVHAYEKYLQNISFNDGRNAGLNSILTIAVYQPHCKINFHIEGNDFSTILPSMYLYDVDPHCPNNNFRVKELNDDIQRILGAYGYRFDSVYLPAKTVALASGLAKLGRNNLCYIDGCSFYWFATYFTNIPVDKNSKMTKPIILEQCENCSSCLDNCPSGALRSSHTHVKINKCITYHNEFIDEIPLWIDNKWHNSLIGCIRCQSVCPLNRKHMRHLETIISFNEQETTEILLGKSVATLSDELITKIGAINFLDKYRLLSRNLTLLWNRHK